LGGPPQRGGGRVFEGKKGRNIGKKGGKRESYGKRPKTEEEPYRRFFVGEETGASKEEKN